VGGAAYLSCRCDGTYTHLRHDFADTHDRYNRRSNNRCPDDGDNPGGYNPCRNNGCTDDRCTQRHANAHEHDGYSG
jgi:hypothetical protein